MPQTAPPHDRPAHAGWLSGYAIPKGAWDEGFTPAGSAREPYRDTLGALAGADLGELAGRVAARARTMGLVFGVGEERRDFPLDPVPRIFTAAEWDRLARGLAQRVRALDAFCADIHGERAAIVAGVIPERIAAGTSFFEPDLLAAPGAFPAAPWIAVAGLDVVRDGTGRLLVLEDNLRTPSGVAYALCARTIVGEALAELGLPSSDGEGPREIRQALSHLLGGVLRLRPPHAREQDAIVLLSDGPGNSAWFEHRLLAELLGIPLVRTSDLRRRGERLELREDGRGVAVVYRRTDQERARLPDGSLTEVGELLLAPVLAGTLRVVNGFGTGVADDKLVYPYVEDMIRLYLGEEPLIDSVPTFDLGDPGQRAEVFERLDELVIKPRDGHGGRGVLIGASASAGELHSARAEIERDPEGWIAQELVMLSTHPTVIEGRLAHRHVDLRPFVFYDGHTARTLPGGLTRVALREGSIIVNSSRQGGGKDTWVLE